MENLGIYILNNLIFGVVSLVIYLLRNQLKEFLTKDIREEVKKDIEQKVSEINKQIIENKKDTLRVTLMQLIAANKKETYSEIFKLYDEYKQLGGNGYIDGTIAERKKENNIY